MDAASPTKKSSSLFKSSDKKDKTDKKDKKDKLDKQDKEKKSSGSKQKQDMKIDLSKTPSKSGSKSAPTSPKLDKSKSPKGSPKSLSSSSPKSSPSSPRKKSGDKLTNEIYASVTAPKPKPRKKSEPVVVVRSTKSMKSSSSKDLKGRSQRAQTEPVISIRTFNSMTSSRADYDESLSIAPINTQTAPQASPRDTKEEVQVVRPLSPRRTTEARRRKGIFSSVTDLDQQQQPETADGDANI